MDPRKEGATHGHDWFRPSMLSYDCCRVCGVVRRADDNNKHCKGLVKIVLKDRGND